MRIALLFILLTGLFSSIDVVPDIDIKNEESKPAPSRVNDVSLIVEVEGSPEKHKEYIETYHPSIEVVATYDTLFYGLALKGRPERIGKIADLHFIKGIHPVQTYTTLSTSRSDELSDLLRKDKEAENIYLPNQLNTSSYTGKGIKIGVVDTGIDFNHPDLKLNYLGGYDLVDLDDEPMETTEEEGMPTSHGTHVAGIIAAHGNLQGVAPDGDIYAYRALGPGGMGTSIQVIAAIEEAVKDGMDVINLSLGNTVNGPDYPTSKAVNEASKQGVAVVVANGNTGPMNWTVGAPATASAALSVGAFQPTGEIPFLYDPHTNREIPLSPLQFSISWNLDRDYKIASPDDNEVRDKIGLIKQKGKPVVTEVLELQEQGAVAAIIYNIKPNDQEWLVGLKEANVKIPLAIISIKDGRWLEKQQDDVYFKNTKKISNETIADFSSRGPVTVNWMMKPDIIAPGVNILSTVPGGYDILNGTSMAAPHVAGAIAAIKEAQPTWTNEQIFGSIKTTAQQIYDKEGKLAEPVTQGAGLIDIEAAIETETILLNPLLSFGKFGHHIDERTINVKIENVSEEEQQFYFDVPKKEKGLSWHLPQTFTLDAGEEKEIPVKLKVNTNLLEEGTYQGWLHLQSEDDTFTLPYVFLSESAEYPKVMGFSFQLNQLDQDVYQYQMYVAEPVKSIQIQLYDPNSLMFEGTLTKWTDLEVGMNEGEIKRRNVEQRGHFYGLIVVQLENGEFINYDTEIVLE